MKPQKSTAMGNRWRQLHHDNTPAHASRLVQSFLTKHQITQVTQPPCSPELAPHNFWHFPKLKSPLKGKGFQFIDETWENRAADGDWENCVRFQGAYFERDWGVIVLCTLFLVSCIFFNKCLYFSYYMTGYLLDRPDIHIYIYFFFFLSIICIGQIS